MKCFYCGSILNEKSTKNPEHPITFTCPECQASAFQCPKTVCITYTVKHYNHIQDRHDETIIYRGGLLAWMAYWRSQECASIKADQIPFWVLGEYLAVIGDGLKLTGERWGYFVQETKGRLINDND